MASNLSKYNMPVHEVKLNLMQMAVVKAIKKGIKNITVEGSRGVGKSTVLGKVLQNNVKEMPKSTGIIVGASFVQIKTRTLPSTKEGLEMFGLYEDIDYVVGRCGKSLGFEMPFQSPDSWQNVIHFRNGAIAVLVSLDNPNSGRGLNAYWVIGDEAALLDHTRLFNNVLSTNRSVKEEFAKAKMLNSTVFVSSVAMTSKGEWFTNREKLALQNPAEYCFIKANAYVNAHNLVPNYIEKMRAEALSKTIFEAEILNIRPKGVQDGFYAQLKPNIHYYTRLYDEKNMVDLSNQNKFDCTFDNDLIRNVPLQMNLDFGGKINCMTVSQFIRTQNRVNFIKEFFKKHPSIVNELIDEFIEYYKPHQSTCNEVHLYYDKSGNNREANSKLTLAEQVIARLRAAGWKVINKTPRTNNPPHLAKFTLINSILAEQDYKLPVIRINADNCPNLIISMENAPLKGNDAFEKDKSSERSTVILQEHATHFSDTLDYNLYWQFWHLADTRSQSSFPITNLIINP